MTFQVTLYTRENCSLCDVAKEDLQALQAEIPHKLVLVDIDQDPDVRAIYDTRVPVVQAGPFVVDAPFDRKKLHMVIGAGRDSAAQSTEYDGKRYQRRVKRARTISRKDRITHWVTKRFMLVLNIAVFIYVGLPFLAPVLMNAGLTGAARPIYAVYGFTCHQLAFRSWFLFGEQTAYPREAANVEGLRPFGETTGLDEEALLDARRYIGEEGIGYKVAFCERDVAIYAAMLVFGILYMLSKKRILPLPWYLWLAIGWVPIGLDGFSQLFSQLPGFELWPYRESTPLLRTLTGAVFGFTTAWFGFPLVEEAADDTRRVVATKIARIESSK